MITIPDSVKVQRSIKTEGQLLGKARTWLEKEERSPGIHASDILDERLAYWSRVDPRPLSDRLVTMFMVGKVLHAFVISAATEAGALDLMATDSGSKHSDELGIDYSPDLDIGDIPREVKTTRSFQDDVNPMYIEQLLIYMAAKNSLKGQLWVLFLNLRGENKQTEPQFRCYTVSLSQEDLDKVKGEIVAKRMAIEAALGARDHTSLPLCREWKCGRTKCDWWGQCKPEGRWKSNEE